MTEKIFKNFKVILFKVGELKTNCYLILNQEKNLAVLIDPGFLEIELANYIKTNQIKIEFILLTHGHFDHIFAINQIKTNAVYINQLEKDFLTDSFKNAGIFMGYSNFKEPPNLKTFKDSSKIPFLEEEFFVVHTPGHTIGSSCFVFLNQIIFTGDTLFKNSVGRWDLFSGDLTSLKNSVEKLKKLKTNLFAFPGHGDCFILNKNSLFNLF